MSSKAHDYDPLSSPLEKTGTDGLTVGAGILGVAALLSHFTADALDDAADEPEEGAAFHPTDQDVERGAPPEELGERDNEGLEDENVEEGIDDQADMQADAADETKEDEAEGGLSSEDTDEEDGQRENGESPLREYFNEHVSE